MLTILLLIELNVKTEKIFITCYNMAAHDGQRACERGVNTMHDKMICRRWREK